MYKRTELRVGDLIKIIDNPNHFAKCGINSESFLTNDCQIGDLFLIHSEIGPSLILLNHKTGCYSWWSKNSDEMELRFEKIEFD